MHPDGPSNQKIDTKNFVKAACLADLALSNEHFFKFTNKTIAAAAYYMASLRDNALSEEGRFLSYTLEKMKRFTIVTNIHQIKPEFAKEDFADVLACKNDLEEKYFGLWEDTEIQYYRENRRLSDQDIIFLQPDTLQSNEYMVMLLLMLRRIVGLMPRIRNVIDSFGVWCS